MAVIMAANSNGSVVNRLSSNNWRTRLVPAPAVIPAPISDVNVVAVKTLVVAVGPTESPGEAAGSTRRASARVPSCRSLNRGWTSVPTKVLLGVRRKPITGHARSPCHSKLRGLRPSGGSGGRLSGQEVPDCRD